MSASDTSANGRGAKQEDAGNRPLSPHLQVYKWQWTMALSILHRVTGVAASVGTLLLVWWLLALATGPGPFATVQGFIGSWIGIILLIGWTWSLMYHLCNGIRHMTWDTGRALELEAAEKSGWIAVAASALLTVVVWIVAIAA